jgi:hypothetical protein
MSQPNWVPESVPLDRPSAARMYDYFIGGYHNFEIDRRAAQQASAIWPDMPQVMRANRAFLRRAVRYFASEGITQFLDIGSGIPTAGNVHEAARQANPDARVVYVDHDPVAVAHSMAMLGDMPGVAVIQADAREPELILQHPDVRRTLDFRQPVAVLLVSVLHFVTDDDTAYHLVRAFRDVLAPGSGIALVHASNEGAPPDRLAQLDRLYSQTPTPVRIRSRSEIERFFDGFELAEPGVVYLSLWRPEGTDDLFLDDPERCSGFAGVGRKV